MTDALGTLLSSSGDASLAFLRGVDPGPVGDAVASYLASERADTTRTFKTGPRTFDTRGAVLSMAILEAGEEGCAILRVVVRHTTPAVRPDDILSALRAVADLVPPAPPLVTRLAQGPLVHGVAAVADPLATDGKVGGS